MDEENTNKEPVIEVVVEATDDGMVRETKTTTITEVVIKPSQELIDSYDKEIANLDIGIQNNLDQIEFLKSEKIKFENLKADAKQAVN